MNRSLLLTAWLAVVPVAAAFELVLDASRISFDEYLLAFRKSYSNPIEFQQRFEVFHRNMQLIASHNQQYSLQKQLHSNNQQHHYFMGVNQYTDMDATELPTGYDKLQSTARRIHATKQLPFVVEPLTALPKAVDWRAAGVTTPVKNQGACGSCWAFASTAVLESHVAITTGKVMTLSVQELVSCAPNPRHCGGKGACAGATAELAFQHVAQHGMVQEWEFGYQSYHGQVVNCSLVIDGSQETTTTTTTTNSLRGSFGNTGNITENESQQYQGAVAGMEGYMTLPSNDYLTLMNAVAKHGPVAVSVACLPWHLYQGGIFYAPLNSNDTRATDINHLVVLEGYGEDPMTGEQYWLVRNSWSPLWGEDGYIRLWRVDPSTLHDPDQDCGMDRTPADGIACTQDDNNNPIIPAPAKICGNSGILYDATIPIGAHLLLSRYNHADELKVA